MRLSFHGAAQGVTGSCHLVPLHRGYDLLSGAG